ncbi:MAG: hypothetical protein VB074_07990 [Proteiniphilum sp.]|mgnify:CR=1 FL=1|uniref:hypothetical protein n=1 Tax=Proteiniphilum sp. TaxID=1926877 RepID=UPI00092CD4B3|nr:hypothetical protein [Proteiniphilum sp.]MEA5128107.1 hypothetical protein [Proteiniphilum sp.]OJV85910.1 MAG: hypothetical protein BGO34_03115 [Bacteroidia bacterium 44-10]
MGQKFLRIIFFLSIIVISFSCDDDKASSVTLYEAGVVDAEATGTNIGFGETVTYTDLSTKVHTRKWTFQGGFPATSTDPVVTVTYPVGGDYSTVLDIVFIDNQKGQFVFDVHVEKDPGTVIPEYDFGTTYGIYTESEDITPGVSSVVAVSMNHFPGERTSQAFEGVQAYSFKPTGESNWAMGGLQVGNNGEVDFSPFIDGYYNFGIRSECQADMLIRIRCKDGGNAVFTFTAEGEEYGFARDGRWHLVSIPVAEIVARDSKLNLARINDFLLFRSADDDVRNYDNYEFSVDHIFLSEKVELK